MLMNLNFLPEVVSTYFKKEIRPFLHLKDFLKDLLTTYIILSAADRRTTTNTI